MSFSKSINSDSLSVVMTTPTCGGIRSSGLRTRIFSLRALASSMMEWYTGKSSVTTAIVLYL
ncbi:MAG: hypothetical protein OIN86_12070 [Candidatus Methanoperedens sp.]|nr:hypothetical protein [Candidatus Methanoperedens sp.]